jgi:peroxiredoxin
MKKRVVLSLSIMIGMPIMLIFCLRVVRAASPSQPEYPSCDSFGIQRSQEKTGAPAFSLKGLDGKQVSLSDFKGKPVLIVFWATWWSSCREELLALEKFFQGKRDPLTILLITIDGERKRAAQKVINQNKITLPVLLLLKERTMDQYGVRGWMPQTFLVDQEGMLVGKIIGQRDWSSPGAWSCMKELFGLHWQIPEIFVSICWLFLSQRFIECGENFTLIGSILPTAA